MSVTNAPEKTKLILWGKSGGRCEYRGCNECLYRDSLTQSVFNEAYIAHIVADKANGPRGDAVLSEQLKAELSNLMLMCDAHHRLIDKVEVAHHTVELLREMKREHEERIERLTDIGPNMQSHIILYRANVGEHTPELCYDSVKEYLPPRYPAESRAIDIGLSKSPQRDTDELFWKTEQDILEKNFNQLVMPRLRNGEFKHISLFAFAPQPLLIKLGTMFSDIQAVEIHQPIRTPKTWRWQASGEDATYKVLEPENIYRMVALNISLSATINNDRIHAVLGQDCSVFTLTIDNPFNDFMTTKKHLQDFSVEIRKLFDLIKSKYDAHTPLHVFPAMPVSAAIEMGMRWMPKADMPLVIYDQNTATGGFSKSLEIRNT